MKHIRSGFLALLVAVPAALHAQNDVSRLFFDAVPFAGSGGRARVDLFVAVPYGAVQFQRQEAQFSATYRLHLQVRQGSQSAYDTTIERTTTTRRAEITSGIQPTYDFFQVPTELPPGSYEAQVELFDVGSNLQTTRKRNVSVIDYRSFPFALSGLMLVGKIREDSVGHVVTPMLSENVSAPDDGFFIFFEAYNSGSPRDVVLAVSYRTTAGARVEDTLRIRRSVSSGTSQQWLHLKPQGIARGTYVLELRALATPDTSRTLASTERNVTIASGASGMPITQSELDDRIAQLRYVATQSEMDEVREAGTFADRKTRFATFWQHLDPTPGTPDNEAMMQYYTRIDYANEHFRSYAVGWLTDQGRVYTIFGPPDNITRQPFRSDGRAIEVWQYYRRGNLEIRFEDESGFGDFRLRTPISNLEKYRYEG